MSINNGQNRLLQNPWFKNVLIVLIMAVIGFVLLNLTFLFYFLIFQIFGLFIPAGTDSLPSWLPVVRHITFLIIIAFISWVVFHSRLPTLLKAAYLVVPAAVILITPGMFLDSWPVLPYIIGALLILGVLFYFYRSRQPWLYSCSLILIALGLLAFNLSGGEI